MFGFGGFGATYFAGQLTTGVSGAPPAGVTGLATTLPTVTP